MNLRTTVSLSLALTLNAALQAQIRAPEVGIARYADQTVRAIYGLPADYVIGKRAMYSADAISFSDSAGLVSRGGYVQLVKLDGSLIGAYHTGETSLLLNVDGDLKTAIVWLPSRQAVLHWDGRAFVLTPLTSPVSGRVTSARIEGPGSARLLFADSENNVFEAFISLETGDLSSLNFLPGVRGPAFQQGSFIVFHDQEGLEIQSPSGDVRTVPLSAIDLTFERMSSYALHLSSASTKRDWVLHLNGSVLKLSQLPALPEAAK